MPEKKAFTLEMLDLTLSANLKSLLVPFFEDISPDHQLQRFGIIFSQASQTIEQRSHALLTCPQEYSNRWMRACAANTAGQPEQITGSLIELFLSLVALRNTRAVERAK